MRWLLALVLSALCAPPAHALDIRPVNISVPAVSANAELWLENPERSPWSGQARLYRWTQDGDAERLVPAQEVAVSPVQLEIAAGQGQRLRVVRLGPAPAGDQQGYRLVLSPRQGHDTRYSLPVFLEPAGGAALSSRLRVSMTGHSTAPRLRLYNDGNAHAHLADLAFVDSRGRRQQLIDGLAGYVLPRSTRSWDLPPRPDGYAGGRFQARLDHAAEAILAPAAAEIAGQPESGL